jgi:hypothetical protein
MRTEWRENLRPDGLKRAGVYVPKTALQFDDGVKVDVPRVPLGPAGTLNMDVTFAARDDSASKRLSEEPRTSLAQHTMASYGVCRRHRQGEQPKAVRRGPTASAGTHAALKTLSIPNCDSTRAAWTVGGSAAPPGAHLPSTGT